MDAAVTVTRGTDTGSRGTLSGWNGRPFATAKRRRVRGGQALENAKVTARVGLPAVCRSIVTGAAPAFAEKTDRLVIMPLLPSRSTSQRTSLATTFRVLDLYFRLPTTATAARRMSDRGEDIKLLPMMGKQRDFCAHATFLVRPISASLNTFLLLNPRDVPKPRKNSTALARCNRAVRESRHHLHFRAARGWM